MCDSTLAIYCFIDDFLEQSGCQEDIRIEVSDAQVMTIAHRFTTWRHSKSSR